MLIRVKFLPVILFLLAACVLVSSDVSASGKKEKKIKWVRSKTGIDSLMTLSKDREGMIRVYRGETERYEFLKKAIDESRLNRGANASSVIRDFGEPIVVVSGDTEGSERWVYKKSGATYFKGPRISLSFSEEKLSGWSVLD